MVEMMVGMMKTSMESELVFSRHKSAELVKINGESGYTRRFLCERMNKTPGAGPQELFAR